MAPSWFLNSQEKKSYFDQASRQNSIWHGEGRSSSFFGVAKPVIVFDGESYEPQWRIRTQTSNENEPLTVLYTALKPEGGCAPNPAENRKNIVPKAPPCVTDDSDLGLATANLISAYEICTHAGDRRQILHTLHRLQVYLQAFKQHNDDGKKARAAPGVRHADDAKALLPPPTVAPVALKNYTNFMRDVRQRLEHRSNRSPMKSIT